MVGSLPGLRWAFSAPRPSPMAPVTTTMIAMTGVMNGVVVGGCIAVKTVTAAPAGNSTGAADRVSQPVEPTARVLLQHGRSSLGPSKAPAQRKWRYLKRRRASAYLYRGTVVGWVSLPQNWHYPPASPMLDLDSGRVADGGVTPSSDSTMMGATVWHTCINKHRTRYIHDTLAS
jgi:hypothetical protein